MKTTKAILTAGILLLASAIQSFSIDGLNISVQCPDVILSWPSIPGESYIVLYRPTLDPSTPWVTLTNSLPANWTTNWTVFVHSNQVQCPSSNSVVGGGGGSGGPPSPDVDVMDLADSQPAAPLAMPANGSGCAVPLILFPPGFDLSNYIILDPSTGDCVSGAGYTIDLTALNGARPNGPQPMGGGSGGGPDPATSETGFYAVVQDGVRIADSSMTVLTNGILSNTISIGFEAGNAANDGTGTNLAGDLNCATVLADGVKIPGGTISFNPMPAPCQFQVDTRYVANGDHTLSIRVQWIDQNYPDQRNCQSRYSDSVSLTVSNQISYPNWEPAVGETNIAAFFLQTVDPSAPYKIDIFDESGNYLQSLTGEANNGTIGATWNLADTNGVLRTNAAVNPTFASSTTLYPGTGSAFTITNPPKIQYPNDWPFQGEWVISYEDIFKYDYSQGNEMQQSIDAFAEVANEYGGAVLYSPQPGATNDIGQTYPLRYENQLHPDSCPTEEQVNLDIAMLWTFLTNSASRNFYYNGHGSGNEIAEWLTAGPLSRAMNHRYRFVFLDGCSTATGSWDSTFGMYEIAGCPIEFYQSTGIRPSAFCGYSHEVTYALAPGPIINGVEYDASIPWQVPGFITDFLFYWSLEGYGLSDAFAASEYYIPPVQGFDTQPGQYLQIYGYGELGIDDYNYGSDWP